MPKELHIAIARSAKRKGLTGDRYKRYVYGTLNKIEHAKDKVKGTDRARALLKGGTKHG